MTSNKLKKAVECTFKYSYTVSAKIVTLHNVT